MAFDYRRFLDCGDFLRDIRRSVCYCAFCRENNVGGLGALIALFDIELHRLADLQILVLTVACAVVKEHISGALDGNKTETLVGLRLDNTCRHGRSEKEVECLKD